MSIISAFPGTGKSYYAKHHGKDLRVFDMESSEYSREQFPLNYLDAIQNRMDEDLEDILLVSSHKAVRDGLLERGISFILVYPDKSLKDEYIERYISRGNSDLFVSLLDKMWEIWVQECEEVSNTYVTKCRLVSGQYLSDVI